MSFTFLVELKERISEAAESGSKATEKLTKKLEKLGEMSEFAEGALSVGTFAFVGLSVAAAGASFALFEGAKTALEVGEAHEQLASVIGEDMITAIRSLEKEVPQSEQQLGEWAKTLKAAGVESADVTDNLRAMASSQALVTGGAEKTLGIFEKLAEQQAEGTKIKFSSTMLKGTGVTQEEMLEKLGMSPEDFESAKKHMKVGAGQIADALRATLIEKGAAPLEKQANSLGAMFGYAGDRIRQMFEGINYQPFLVAMGRLLHLFDDSQPSAKAMRVAIVGTFDKIFVVLAKVTRAATIFFLDLIIWGLKAYIVVIKPMLHHLDAVKAAFVGLGAGMMALGIVGVIALAPMIASAWALAIAVIAATWPVLAIVAAVALAAAGIFYFRKQIAAAIEWLGNAAAAASVWADNLIGGLVAGIVGGVGRVVAAVKNMASSALDAFTSHFKIHSDSVVMKQMGGHITGGLETGITSTAGGPQAAMTNMVSAPQPIAQNNSRSTGGSLHLEINIIGAGKDAKTIAEMVKADVADLFEQMSLAAGV